jgi:hypothetical protein
VKHVSFPAWFVKHVSFPGAVLKAVSEAIFPFQQIGIGVGPFRLDIGGCRRGSEMAMSGNPNDKERQLAGCLAVFILDNSWTDCSKDECVSLGCAITKLSMGMLVSACNWVLHSLPHLRGHVNPLIGTTHIQDIGTLACSCRSTMEWYPVGLHLLTLHVQRA